MKRDEVNKWWYEIGSGMAPLPEEDHEEFAYRIAMAAIAAEREACAKVCEAYDSGLGQHYKITRDCAAAIRARSTARADSAKDATSKP